MVGRLVNANALASVSLANSVFFSMFVLGLGISLAIPPLVSAAHAQKNDGEIHSVFRHGFILNIGVGLVLMLFLLAFRPLLWHMDQPIEILPNASDYLTIMALSLVPFMAFQTLREVSEGLGYTIGVTIATILANILNIIFNYLLITGSYGFPKMGVLGSAVSTLMARIFMLILLYFIVANHKTTKRFIRAFSLRFHEFKKEIFSKMLKLGLPTALQMFFEVTAFAGASFICGLVSSRDIASHQIALSLASFSFNLCIGISVASTIMIGRKMGENNFIELRKIGINNLKITFLFMLVCGLVFIFGRNTLAAFFARKEEAEVIASAAQLLIIAALFQLSDGIQVVSLGILRGMQDVKKPSLITFIAYWIITIPMGYILCVRVGMGALGMWIAFGVGLTFSALFLVARFLKSSSERIN